MCCPPHALLVGAGGRDQLFLADTFIVQPLQCPTPVGLCGGVGIEPRFRSRLAFPPPCSNLPCFVAVGGVGSSP
jgi:hypothetical protein